MIGTVGIREAAGARVREIVATVKGCPTEEVRLESTLEETFGDDSLDLLHFVFELERRFDVRSGTYVSHLTLAETLREAGRESLAEFAARVIDGRPV